MRMSITDYIKIVSYAIKNQKVSEFVDLKIQKDSYNFKRFDN